MSLSLLGSPSSPFLHFNTTTIPPIDSMMLYLKFDQGDFSGNTIANWATGSAVYNITIYGANSAKVNTTLQKVGSGCMDVSDETKNNVPDYSYNFINKTGPYSIAIWFKKPNTNNSGTIINLGGCTYVRFITSTLQIGTEGNIGTYTGYNDNKWHHVVYIMRATGTSSVYIDGIKNSELGNPFPIPATFVGKDIVIGNNIYNNSPFWGYIDDARVYTRVLTEAEVTTIYKNRI